MKLRHLGLVLLIGSLLWGCTEKTDKKDTTIHSSLSVKVKGLDPISANDLYSSRVVAHIYETLYEYHYLKRPLELKPLLAKGMPKSSSDGLTHTIELKKGIYFANDEAFPAKEGREVTAQDFIYSWKRLADPNKRSEGFWVFDNRIKGLNEWRDKVAEGEADYDTPIEGLKAPDKHTLKITLTKPFYQLYYILAMPYTAAVPKEAVDKYGEEFLNNPVGTGPYQLEEWVRGSKITLTENPNWHGQKYPTEGEPGDKEKGLLEDAGKSLPFAKKLVFHIITEGQPQWLKLMQGDLDFAGIPKDNFDTAMKSQKQLSPKMKKKGFQLDIRPEPDVTYTAFNMKDEFLGEHKAVRRAMSLARDTKTLIEKFYNGRAIDAESMIPPGVKAYEEDYENPWDEYNLEKAKKLLKDAGFENGEGIPELEFSTTSSSTARQMAEFFKQNMSKLGIDIKIVTYSWPQFTARIRDQKAQIWGIAWSADYPDAENFLQLLYGKNVSPGPNGANYQNDKFDKLFEKAAVTPPGPDRTKLYHQMRDIAVDDMPWIYGTHRLGYSIYHSWLKNFKPHRIIGNTLKYMRVDSKERAKQKPEL